MWHKLKNISLGISVEIIYTFLIIASGFILGSLILNVLKP